jgi:hypothetical protein
MAKFKILFQNFPGGTEGNYEKNLRIVIVSAEIRIGHLPNTLESTRSVKFVVKLLQRNSVMIKCDRPRHHLRCVQWYL